jgi:Family of unknown function (DUF6232)
MEDRVLYDAHYTTVTQTVARFGSATYQVRNIDSVTINDTRRLNPVAVVLFLASLLPYGLAYVYLSITALIVGSALVLAAILWQSKWPRWEYRLVLRTSGGDSEVVVTRDRKHVLDLKAAIEQAFVSRA